MPYSNNSGGPWGGGGDGGDDDDRNKRPQNGQQPPVPDIDEIVRKGQEQLKVLMGGGRGGGNGSGAGGGGLGKGPIVLVAVAALVLWGMASFYRVDTSEQSVELLFGDFQEIGDEGLNFAPWPFVTHEVVAVTTQRTEAIGTKGSGGRADLNKGLMLTGDENIVDIYFEVVWNINSLENFLFNLADAKETVAAVSESAMREVIGRSNFATILTEDRGAIADEVRELIQTTLNGYESGISIVRLNFDEADPPAEVIDSFLDVQAAEQERATLENRADAYANERLAAARGASAQMLLQAEGYRAQVVNTATGEASRFLSVYEVYAKAEEVTRKRLYLETMERVLSDVTIIILDETEGGQGVVPYLPLNELNKGGSN